MKDFEKEMEKTEAAIEIWEWVAGNQSEIASLAQSKLTGTKLILTALKLKKNLLQKEIDVEAAGHPDEVLNG